MGDVIDVEGRRNEQRPVLVEFDFGAALGRSPREVIAESVEWFRERQVARELVGLFDPIPLSAASTGEITALEESVGVSLPGEYRVFLKTTRSITVDDGARIFGVLGSGSTAGEPWISDGHMAGRQFLVFGDYWGFADGDQLLFDMSIPSEAVFLYLHDPPFDRGGPTRRPCLEEYASSFSLALSRLVSDVSAWDAESDEE